MSVAGEPVEGVAASVVVAVLERCWEAIRGRHPQVPEVVVVMASGSDGRVRLGLKLGHFAASRWRIGQHVRAEVLINKEASQLLPPPSEWES